MGFTKITNAELNAVGATTQPNQPTIGASALKQVFDAPAKQVVAPKFNNLIDELESTTSAQSLGAVAPTGFTGTTVQGVINSVASAVSTTEQSAHTHLNKSVLDKFSDDGTGIKYDGASIEGAVKSVNNKTGDVSLTATDVGALPDSTTIPTKTSDLTNDSDFVDSTTLSTALDDKVDKVSGKGLSTNDYDDTAKGIVDGATAAIAAKSTVAYQQTYLQAGQKIGTITIDGTPTDIVAPTGGGGGGGGDVTSVNNQTGDVSLGIDDMDDASIASLSDQDALVYNGTAGTWGNEPLADVALSGSIGDLTEAAISSPSNGQILQYNGTKWANANMPSIPDGLADLTDDVAISSPSSGQILQHNGTKWANANMPSIPDGLADLTDDVSISSPSNDQVLKYNGTSGKWVNGAAPASGHTMLPDPTVDPSTLVPPKTNEQNVVDAVNLGIVDGYDNQNVASLNTIGTWSNTVSRDYMVQATAEHPIGTSGFGDWEDESTMDGWIAIADLYNISAKEYTIEPIYDPTSFSGVQPIFRGYKIEDNTTATIGGQTVNCGKICMLFANEISDDDKKTARVGIRITISRTPISYITP